LSETQQSSPSKVVCRLRDEYIDAQNVRWNLCFNPQPTGRYSRTMTYSSMGLKEIARPLLGLFVEVRADLIEMTNEFAEDSGRLRGNRVGGRARLEKRFNLSVFEPARRIRATLKRDATAILGEHWTLDSVSNGH
jgi:hypothetical protein